MLATTAQTAQQMDATLVTATMYTAGGVANLVVVLNIMRRWPGRGASLSAALSISAVSLSISCGKAIYDVYNARFSRYESKVFRFWYTAHLHLLTNIMLTLTVQAALRAVVAPLWVRIRVTRRACDKCISMQWFLMMVVYSPVLIVQFLMNRDDLDELMFLLKDVVTLVIFVEGGLTLLLTVAVLATLILRRYCYAGGGGGSGLSSTGTSNGITYNTGVGSNVVTNITNIANGNMSEEDIRLQRYWLFLVFLYVMMLPDLVFTFVTLYSSPTLSMLKSISSFGIAIDYIVFFMVIRR